MPSAQQTTQTVQSDSRYVVGLKRGCDAPADWKEQVSSVPGINLVTPISEIRASARRILISGSVDAVATLTAKVGSYCHVEQEIMHGSGQRDLSDFVMSMPVAPHPHAG